MGRNRRGNDRPPTKWQVYEQILHVPYYVVFNRYTNEIRFFKLVRQPYQELSLLNNQFWFDELQLGLGLWKGVHEGRERLWLRWYEAKNQWILTPAEEVARERQRANQAEQQLVLERQRTEQLAAKLRALGIDPESL